MPDAPPLHPSGNRVAVSGPGSSLTVASPSWLRCADGGEIMIHPTGIGMLISLLALPSLAGAQTPGPAPFATEATESARAAQDTEQTRPTGLPSSISWKFNFDAGWG